MYVSYLVGPHVVGSNRDLAYVETDLIFVKQKINAKKKTLGFYLVFKNCIINLQVFFNDVLNLHFCMYLFLLYFVS